MLVVEFDGDQQRTVALQLAHAAADLVQVFGCHIVDPKALAAGHQAFAQLGVAGQVEVQAQRCTPAFPAPQAQQGEDQSRQQAVDQQHAHQPGGPGLAGAFDIQRGVAAGADHLHGGHIETEQSRECAKGLGHGDKGIGAENGGFPHKPVAAGGEQRQQDHQGAEQGQQPQAVDQHTHRPAIEFLPLQQQQQRRGQLCGLGITRQFLAEPQPQPPEAGAVFAGKQQAQGPTDQQDKIQAEQAAQGPEHIHRGQAIAQRGERQTGAADDGDHRQ